MNKIIAKIESLGLWLFRWFCIDKNPNRTKNALLIICLIVLFVPYFVFTLPASFLEGSFDNEQKKMKIAMSFVGYFLLAVFVCMALPILNHYYFIPENRFMKTALLIGKVWDILAFMGSLLMIASVVRDINLFTKSEKYLRKSYFKPSIGVRLIFKGTVA